MRCKYTGCASNSSHQSCAVGLTPNKCSFGRNEKRIEVAYEKGIKYGKAVMAKRLLKVVFPSFEKDICDAICDGVEKGQSNQEIFDRIDHIKNIE